MISEFILGTTLDDTGSLDAGTSSLFDGSSDVVLAGAGDETVEFSDFSASRVFLGTGADQASVGTDSTVSGGAGNDIAIVVPLNANSRLFGGAGNDSLFANGNDQLFGGEGDDVLSVVETGGSLLAGNAGADDFRITNPALPEFASVIADFDSAEGDEIIISGLGAIGFGDLTLEAIDGDTLVSLSADQPLALVLNTTALAEADFVFEASGDGAIEGTASVVDPFNVIIGDGQTGEGTPEADITTVAGSDNIANGGEGDDELNVAEGTGNTLNGDGGSDVLDSSNGGGGNILDGGEGDDELFAGTGDTAIGGGGDDVLVDAQGAGGITFDITGEGSDTVFLVAGEALPAAPNVVSGFTSGDDLLGLVGIADLDEFADLTLEPANDGADTSVSVGDTLVATLTGVEAASLGESDFLIDPGPLLFNGDGVPPIGDFNLDIDGNGNLDALTDILNILRVELNAPVESIVLGEDVPDGVTQETVFNVIAAELASETSVFDFDGNADVTAVEDILNLLRVELSAPTESLVIGTDSPLTQGEIEAQIAGLISFTEQSLVG